MNNKLFAQHTRLPIWLKDWHDPSSPDTLRFKAADRLARRGYFSYIPDSALYYANALFDFAKAKNDRHWMAQALKNKVRILRRTGTYQEVLDVLGQTIKIQEELEDTKGLAYTYKRMGYALRKLGKFEEALKNDQISLDLATSLGEEGNMARAAVHNEMGSLFMDQESFDKTLEHYLKSLELNLAADEKGNIAGNYNNIGVLYLNLKDFDQSLEYMHKSLAIKQELNDLEGMGNVYQTLGRISFLKKQYGESKRHYETAFKFRDSIDHKSDLAITCSALGLLELEAGEPVKAQEWCLRGLKYAQEVGDIEETARNCNCLYQAYEADTRFDSALFYHKEYKLLYDSLFNEENTRKLTKLESEYIYEKERTQLESKLREQQFIRNIVIVIGIALFIFAYLMWRLTRIRKKKNERIEKDKAIITQQAAELRTIDAMKSRFFTNISHELRTPLTLIISPIQHLLKQENYNQLPFNVQQILKNAFRNAGRLLSLVEELLELSRIEAGEQQLNLTPVAPGNYTQQLFNTFEARAKVKNITYQFYLNIPNEMVVKIDKNRFAKIVYNLLGNALKFTPKGGKITLNLASHPDHNNKLVLSVKDTGRGILPEDLPYIFDRYFQTKNKHIPTEGGTGIGLALSKELAELMGGSLEVESKWGEGTTFILVLPTQETNQEIIFDKDELPTPLPLVEELVTPATKLPNTPGNHSKKKILIVEDNPDMQQLISSLIADRYDYLLVNNGKEAWQLLEKGPPSVKNISLIISDILMPEMDGYELLNRVKEHKKWRLLPVIMLTALAGQEDKLKALRMGVDDYVPKPFTAEELLARIDNLIDNYEQRQEFEQLAVNLELEASPSADQDWLSAVEAFCLEAIEKKIEITTGYLASKMVLSERQTLRKLKSLTGLSTHKYIQEIKLQKARQLLETQKFKTIAEVAYECGFNTPSYFTKVFEFRYGKRPIEYLEKQL